MAVYYVDLSTTGGSHAGTDVDPFSINNWYSTAFSGTNSDTFYMKGIGSIDTEPSMPWSDATFSNWVGTTSWTPQINFTSSGSNSFGLSGLWDNCIIMGTDHPLFVYSSINSCFLSSNPAQGGGIMLGYGHPTILRGCTLVSDIYINARATLIDSLLVGTIHV